MGSSVDISSIKTTIEKILSGKEENDTKDLLENFITKASQLYTFNEINRFGYTTALWSKLFELMGSSCPAIQLLCLESIRILTRDSSQFGSVLSKERINVLLQFANILNDDRTPVDTDYRTVGALKCLYNIIYNSKDGLNIIINNNNCIERILYRVENGDSKLMSQIKLFDMKVLFLVSALCKDVRDLVKEKHGIKHLIKKLEYIQDSASTTLSTPEAEVFCEILKILFNLSLSITDDQEDQDSCTRLVGLLRHLLHVTVLNDQIKVKLHSNIVNLLTNMPYACYSQLITAINSTEYSEVIHKYEGYNIETVHHLLAFLQNRLERVPADKLQELTPILTVLLRASSSVRYIRKYLRITILPPLRDVSSRPEEGNTLRNQLCKLLTSSMSTVSDLVANFLFVLCKEKVGRMIKHTGYGNAAGLLAQRGLLAGGIANASFSSESEDSDTEEYRQNKDSVNPVTGCVEPPHPNPLEGMTEEQKEHEVMQLVNLMDDLSRNGVIKPCKIGEDGKLQPVEHILELQESLPAQQIQNKKKE